MKELKLVCSLKTHIRTECYVWKRWLTSFLTVTKEPNNNQAHHTNVFTSMCYNVKYKRSLLQQQQNACMFDVGLVLCGTLCPAKILAIGLYRLAHGNSYLTIGPAFNVGKSTVMEAVQDVVGALYELLDDHIKFPKNLAEVTTLIQSFEELSVLPNIVGAIDGFRVGIKVPPDSAANYFNWYQQYDFIVQAVVNGNKFSWISLVNFLVVCMMFMCC